MRCESTHWSTYGNYLRCEREQLHLGEMHYAQSLLWEVGRKAPYRYPNRWHNFRVWLARKVDPPEWDGEPK